MPDPVLLQDDRGAVRILRLNRPDKLNALNTALTGAVLDALLEADQADDVRAVVLTGEGRAFCAGADLAEFKDLTPDKQHLVTHRAELSSRMYAAAQGMAKPVVSAVRGPAVGGGAGLAIGCDMVVAGGDLKLGWPELKHQIVPALVMTGLQRHLGRKAAFELISLGRLLGAEEARALGLVNRVVAPDAVLDEAIGIAEAWSRANPRAMAATKRLFYRVADLPFDAAMEAGREVNTQMRGFRDSKA